MNRLWIVVTATALTGLAVVGCGDKDEEIPPSDFTEEDYAEWFCDWQFNVCPEYKMTTTDSVEECLTEMTSEADRVYEECVWRGDKAEECVAAVDSGGACSVASLTGACLEVWDCSALWDTTDTE